ncbi:hypothetical protein GAYE_FCTG49G0037 [Galdieria yellowstonensis]|uniref:Protein YIPF n=1 Tax=Galdieria yellowstonensis TaxID=3028027 RepID=A0AAV9I616_9RHOD|nr:hypothetical protein GAYE_FCTG49G0037 [Galdieria yellowstonensis]
MDAAAFQESTLDEPVWNTIKRDLGLIGRRLKLVILPKVTAMEMQAELRDWDLWGPLFICMTLATVLSVEASEDASLIFSCLVVQFRSLWAYVFWDIVFGAAVVVRFVTVVLLLFWSIMAVTAFFADVKLPEGRKLLAVYPVFLFYSGIAWMVLVGFQEHK